LAGAWGGGANPIRKQGTKKRNGPHHPIRCGWKGREAGGDNCFLGWDASIREKRGGRASSFFSRQRTEVLSRSQNRGEKKKFYTLDDTFTYRRGEEGGGPFFPSPFSSGDNDRLLIPKRRAPTVNFCRSRGPGRGGLSLRRRGIWEGTPGNPDDRKEGCFLPETLEKKRKGLGNGGLYSPLMESKEASPCSGKIPFFV